jgi:hypothetical protein
MSGEWYMISDKRLFIHKICGGKGIRHMQNQGTRNLLLVDLIQQQIEIKFSEAIK